MQHGDVQIRVEPHDGRPGGRGRRGGPTARVVPATTCAFVTTKPGRPRTRCPGSGTRGSSRRPSTSTVLGAAARNAAVASAPDGGSTGSAGHRREPDEHVGEPEERQHPLQLARSSRAAAASRRRGPARSLESRIPRASCGNGPLARFSARNQVDEQERDHGDDRTPVGVGALHLRAVRRSCGHGCRPPIPRGCPTAPPIEHDAERDRDLGHRVAAEAGEPGREHDADHDARGTAPTARSPAARRRAGSRRSRTAPGARGGSRSSQVMAQVSSHGEPRAEGGTRVEELAGRAALDHRRHHRPRARDRRGVPARGRRAS